MAARARPCVLCSRLTCLWPAVTARRYHESLARRVNLTACGRSEFAVSYSSACRLELLAYRCCTLGPQGLGNNIIKVDFWDMEESRPALRHEECRSSPVRNVFLGLNSSVWRALSRPGGRVPPGSIAIGHLDLAAFSFRPSDRVWVLSYSRFRSDNLAMLEYLGMAGVSEIVYVSSSSVIVDRLTTCYTYPREKGVAERFALTLPNSRVLTLGLVYERPDQLPGGVNVATSYDELAGFCNDPQWKQTQGRRSHLFHLIERPFRHPVEALTYRCYSRLVQWAEPWPCVLRPLDVLLRTFGVRWYGYVFLSNRLWCSTIS